ncbi:hypothetical protein Tco_1573108 [Tanacetum coccineum]
MINFSAASSTWSPSSSPLLNGKGESVILSSLTIGLFPNRDKAGDALMLLVQKLQLLVLKVNAAGMKVNAAGMKVTTAERVYADREEIKDLSEKV